jgi:hypothetical protein
MFLYLTSTIAAVAAVCISAFSLFWAALCIFFGGPDGRTGHEAIMIGLLFIVLGLITAYAARLLFAAPNKAEPRPALYNFALKSSPLLALLFTALLGMAGKYVLFYSLLILALVLGVRWVRIMRLRNRQR